MAGGVPAFIEARRSIRAFLPDPVPRAELDRLVEAACLSPAPHHSRPWRWVVVDASDRKEALARGMGDRWRRDLGSDGVLPARIEELVGASHAKLTGAPATSGFSCPCRCPSSTCPFSSARVTFANCLPPLFGVKRYRNAMFGIASASVSTSVS